jgi:hypothetical protein
VALGKLKTLALLLGLALVAGILVVMVSAVEAATPYYTTGDHTIRMVVKFDSDCWKEIYARATPKHNNHVLLNFIIIPNDDKPDAGPSETVYIYLPFKDAKMVQTKSTNENRIRSYVTIELVNGADGETVTKYMAYDKDKRVQDFGTFLLHTDKSLCQ